MLYELNNVEKKREKERKTRTGDFPRAKHFQRNNKTVWREWHWKNLRSYKLQSSWLLHFFSKNLVPGVTVYLGARAICLI